MENLNSSRERGVQLREKTQKHRKQEVCKMANQLTELIALADDLSLGSSHLPATSTLERADVPGLRGCQHTHLYIHCPPPPRPTHTHTQLRKLDFKEQETSKNKHIGLY